MTISYTVLYIVVVWSIVRLWIKLEKALDIYIKKHEN